MPVTNRYISLGIHLKIFITLIFIFKTCFTVIEISKKILFIAVRASCIKEGPVFSV